MEATERATAAESSENDHKGDPRWEAARRAAQGEKGREMLEHAAQGAELNATEEVSALDWLLGNPRPIVHDISVEVETPAGMATLTFVARRIDPRKIDGIEIRNVNQSSQRIDRITADCEIVAECCDEMIDATGRRVSMTSEEFLTVELPDPHTGDPQRVKLANPAMALERRFVGQVGLLTSVAAEIRRLGGYDPQRLGTSQRRLVEASLG